MIEQLAVWAETHSVRELDIRPDLPDQAIQFNQEKRCSLGRPSYTRQLCFRWQEAKSASIHAALRIRREIVKSDDAPRGVFLNQHRGARGGGTLVGKVATRDNKAALRMARHPANPASVFEDGRGPAMSIEVIGAASVGVGEHQPQGRIPDRSFQ